MALFIILSYLKNEHLKKRNGKKKLSARVNKHEMVTSKVRRNHYHTERKTYVVIDNEQPPVSYPLNVPLFRSYYINQEIDVFWYRSKLYYWHAYQKGIFKYVPSLNN